MSPRAYTPEQDAVIADRFVKGECMKSLRREFGGSFYAMRSALIRQGVYESRPGGSYPFGHAPQRHLTPDELQRAVALWNAGASCTAIGKDLGITHPVVRRELRNRGLAVVDRPTSAKGATHGNWKGGRTLREGYVFLLLDRGDPFAVMCNKIGYVAEHRLVMARAMGRPLSRTESVHHINGNKADNRLDNLQLRQGQHGKGVAMRCSDCGSMNVEAEPLTGS